MPKPPTACSITKLWLPDGKELVLFDRGGANIRGMQRLPGENEFNPFDLRSLDNSGLPKDTEFLTMWL